MPISRIKSYDRHYSVIPFCCTFWCVYGSQLDHLPSGDVV